MSYNWSTLNGIYGGLLICNLYSIILVILTMISCSQNSDLAITKEIAGPHIDSLQQVIACYQPDSYEGRASRWILSNMTCHSTWNSVAIEAFERKVMQSDSLISKRTLNDWWREVSDKDVGETTYDASVISPLFLECDINTAISTWHHSPWKNEVPFETFCKYVLPYRVADEPLKLGTRNTLLRRYKSIIEGVKDMKIAFAKIHNMLKDSIRTGNLIYTHNPSALMMEKMRMGNCFQRCIHEIYVMRSLGLPVAIDGVPHWANYSSKGHSWVSLITSDGTYYMPEQDSYDGPLDSLPRKCIYLDSSVFYIRHPVEDGYPYSLNFKKRHSIVNRMVFEYRHKDYDDKDASDNLLKYFSDPFTIDVSADYGCTSFSINVDCESSYAYLCTYLTSIGWTPVAYSKRENGLYNFGNIGDSILCLLMVAKNKILYPINTPFLLCNGRTHYLWPNVAQSDSLVIERKYPLIGRFLNNWTELVGGTFEGSDDSLFVSRKIISQIISTPVFRNTLKMKVGRYRYVRYVSPQGIKSPLAEIEIFSGGKTVTGKPFAKGANIPERCFDGNTFTMLDKTHNGYMVGVDLGRPILIDSIVFYPKNDDNFIRPDHEYELNYYCCGKWIPINCMSKHEYTLTYRNIPHNALLLLRDLTGGKEERPFILKNGKVEWW